MITNAEDFNNEIIVEGTTKKKLYYEILATFSIHDVRSETIEVLMKSRNCTMKEAQDIKTLRLKEVEEIKKRFL